MNYNSYNLFPTLIQVFDLKDHPASKRVLDLMNNTETNWHALVQDGESSYNERTKNKFLSNPAISDFATTIQECVDTFTQEAGIERCIVTNSWINKMKKGSRVNLHRHEHSAVSGAYYPTWGFDNAPLIFRNPVAPYKMAELASDSTAYNDLEQEVPGGFGRLILFPSYLEHYTKENNSDERLVLSFNAYYN